MTHIIVQAPWCESSNLGACLRMAHGMQCYVQQLRQLRQDAKKLQADDPPAALSQARQSGDVNWSVLSPRLGTQHFNATLALHLARSGSGPPALATSQVMHVWSYACSQLMLMSTHVHRNILLSAGLVQAVTSC